MGSEDKEKIKKTGRPRKVIFLRILFGIFIVTGLSLILWPVYTNFIASKNISDELSAWDRQKTEALAEESGTSVEGAGSEENDDITIVEESQEESTGTEDVPVMDFSQDGVFESDNSGLTPEDFFPMKITIPKIELEYVVLEGTDSATLKKGAGHESVTPLPGEEGRCTLSGHRTTYGAPFNRVDELEEGDFIYLETLDGRMYVYEVTEQQIVKPTDVWILQGTDKKELLLTTCHPKYSAANRLIIISELIEVFPFENGT